MKKQFLSSKNSVFRIVLAVFVCLWGMNGLLAQTAVLQHEGERIVFYGSDSFKDAYNASIEGDVITLSEGTFNTCNIGKSITIHGAGAYEDTVAGRFATRFYTSFYIVDNCSPNIEGINFNDVVYLSSTHNVHFVKCRFNRLYKYNPGIVTGVHLVNCIIGTLNASYLLGYTGSGYVDNLNIVNSVIWNLGTTFAGQNHVASNSIIRTNDDRTLNNIIAYNSVIVKGVDSPTLGSTCTFYNCIGVGTSVFSNSLNSNVMVVGAISDVFPAFDDNAGADDPFILDEGIAASFLGTDGTEVGIHGGYYPYSNRPGYMKVRHCTVGDRTTDDGHLSVDIEVVTEE